jgi:integrase
MPTIKSTSYLTDARISALTDFDILGLHRDKSMLNLYLRIGIKRNSWMFLDERRIRGERIIVSRVLGHFPAMSAIDARAAAFQIKGEIAEGNAPVGKRKAIKFDAALDEYLAHLRRKAANAGKPARHAYNVESLARLYLRPKFGQWSLADMSADPKAIRDFHRDVTERAGPVSANACIKTIRAAYRFEARANRSLRLDALPTSATVMNVERPRETGMGPDQWPLWASAWSSIRSPVRQAYHLFCLLTGMRPGEAARLRWADVNVRGRSITVRAAKAGADIVVPMSGPIAMALKLARDAGPSGPGDFVFPGSGKSGHIAKGDDGLPVAGNSLRHVYRSIAAELKVDDVSIRLLMGHSLVGVSAGYISRMMMHAGPSLRSAQRAVSKRIVSLLGYPTAARIL